jgi:hypothetical protein
MFRITALRSCVAEPQSALAKQIWKASVRSVRVESIWSNYGKQVLAQSPFLTPRDVATIVHSFARIKYKDEKLLNSLTPSILKHIDAFSVREIVHILSAFRKVEYARLDCLELLMNQLVLKFSEWNTVDVALIANSAAWFRIFDENVWKKIYKYVTKNSHEFSPLGISLVVAGMAKLDLRNEPVLRKLAAQLVSGESQGVFKQESFSLIVHAFYKLGWTRDFHLNIFIEQQLLALLSEQAGFFDQQSLCMILHSLFCYRLGVEKEWSDTQVELLKKGFAAMRAFDQKLSPDQYRRMDELCMLCSRRHSFPFVRDYRREVLRTHELANKTATRGHKLPRWEYEVYRILKDKMEVPVTKKVRNGRTDIFLKPNEKAGLKEEVAVLCLGPFQFYANSTKRTAASILNKLLINHKLVIEIPYYVWNELKTDQDKIMYLYSLGRRVMSAAEQEIPAHVEDNIQESDQGNEELIPNARSQVEMKTEDLEIEKLLH